MMEWNQLLCAERYGSGGHGSNRQTDRRNEFERDCGRILYSSAFRRLQDKTQVFPLGRNDYVRTRLTHSLEVQNVGRSLGMHVGEKLCEQYKVFADIGMTPSSLADIVAAACMAHDIGNPPFGHSGEDAIERALSLHGFTLPFEGNAQGFRVLTRTGDPMEGKGLKLTAAVLGAFMKYPCNWTYARAVKKGETLCANKLESKKFGCIAEDEETVCWVAKKTGLIERCRGKGLVCYCRHPLAFLVEAADDMSYLVADVEDAYISGLISYEEARDHLRAMAVTSFSEPYLSELEGKKRLQEAIHYLRAMAIGSGIDQAAKAFLEHEEEILSGTMERSLMEASCLHEAYASLSSFSVASIYNAPQVVQIEVMGYQVIESLINVFMEWVRNPNAPKSKKLELMMGGQAFHDDTEARRLQHMLDYISGMTDSFALETYRRLHGIAV